MYVSLHGTCPNAEYYKVQITKIYSHAFENLCLHVQKKKNEQGIQIGFWNEPSGNTNHRRIRVHRIVEGYETSQTAGVPVRNWAVRIGLAPDHSLCT